MNIFSKDFWVIKNWKIGTKILLAFTLVAIVAVGLVGFFAFTTGSSTLEEESFNKLTAVREMKASQIEDYFQTIENQIITFSEDRMIIDAMKQCNLSVEDVKMVVPHQVNRRIIDSATEKLGFPPEKVYINIDRCGNTSSASVPIALDEARRTGRIQAGDTIIMVAFGGGLTWGSAVVTL